MINLLFVFKKKYEEKKNISRTCQFHQINSISYINIDHKTAA